MARLKGRGEPAEAAESLKVRVVRPCCWREGLIPRNSMLKG